MKTVSRIALPVLPAAPLAGCDTVHGVDRTAKPALGCWTYTYSFDGDRGGGIHGTLQTVEAHGGTVSFANALLRTNEPPPQAWVDATRPATHAMEQALARRCGASELPSRIQETCDGVQCAPLPDIRSTAP